jgi:hypothetical protein
MHPHQSTRSGSDVTAEHAAEGLLRLRCDTPPASPLSRASPRAGGFSGRLHYRVRSPDPALLPGHHHHHQQSAAAPPRPLPALVVGGGGGGWSRAGGRVGSDADDAGSRAASPSNSGATPHAACGFGGTTPPGSWAGSPGAPHHLAPAAAAGGTTPLAVQMQQALTRFGVEHRKSFNSGESPSPLVAGMRLAAEQLRQLEGATSRGGSPADLQPLPTAAAGAPVGSPASGGTYPVRHPRRRARRRGGVTGTAGGAAGTGDEDSGDEDYTPGDDESEGTGGRAAAARGSPRGAGYRAVRGPGLFGSLRDVAAVASDGDEPFGYRAAGTGAGSMKANHWFHQRATPHLGDACAGGGIPSPRAMMEGGGGGASEGAFPPLSPVPWRLQAGAAPTAPRSGSAPPSRGPQSPRAGRPAQARKGGARRSASKEPKASSKGPCANCGVEKSVLWRCHPENDGVRLCNACGIYRRSTGRDRPTDGVFRGLGKDGQGEWLRRGGVVMLALAGGGRQQDVLANTQLCDSFNNQSKQSQTTLTNRARHPPHHPVGRHPRGAPPRRPRRFVGPGVPQPAGGGAAPVAAAAGGGP